MSRSPLPCQVQVALAVALGRDLRPGIGMNRHCQEGISLREGFPNLVWAETFPCAVLGFGFSLTSKFESQDGMP